MKKLLYLSAIVLLASCGQTEPLIVSKIKADVNLDVLQNIIDKEVAKTSLQIENDKQKTDSLINLINKSI